MAYPSNPPIPLPKGITAVGKVISAASAAASGDFASYASGKLLHDSGFEAIFGTADQFMDRYKNFEAAYKRALETGLDPVRASRANVDFLKAGGKIDLSILEKGVRKELETMYRDQVLQLPTILKKYGLPNVELPSANLYRRLFRYEVDTARNGSGAMHPAMALLNRVMFNVDPNKQGIDAFNVGISNLIGSRQLAQTSAEDVSTILASGKRVKTFDVETTGIFKGAHTRSMGVTEMHNGIIRGIEDRTVNFASPQLGGLTVTGRNNVSRTVNQFLMQGEGSRGIQVGDPAKFLDEATKFLNNVLESDVIAGHNIFFDIESLTGTMQQMDGFSTHAGAKQAVSQMYEAMQQDGRIVDTLEYARTYLNTEVNSMLESAFHTDEIARLNGFRDLIYSPEFLAQVRAGGSAPYASMEAISLNTNLLQLLHEDAMGGDEFAKTTYERIFQGTHIADTDSALQTYMTKYMMQDLVPGDPSQGKMLKVTDRTKGPYGKAVIAAQEAINRSKALTTTTDISDVRNISQDIFDYILSDEKAKQRVSLTLEKGFTDVYGQLDVDGLVGRKGNLQYIGGEYKFTIGEASPGGISQITVPKSRAEAIIEQTLRGADYTDDLDLGWSADPTRGLEGTVKTANREAARIQSLGINVTQAHEINEVMRMVGATGSATGSPITKEALLENIGSTYRMFGSGPGTVADMVDIARGRAPSGPLFKAGLANYGLDPGSGAEEIFDVAKNYARASKAIGIRNSDLSVRSRVFSTVMAESTSGNAQAARDMLTGRLAELSAIEMPDTAILDKITKTTAQLESLKYADYADILPEHGVSHFKGQQQLRLFSQMTAEGEFQPASRLLVPLQMMNDAADAAFGASDSLRKGTLSVSLAKHHDGTERVNLFWKLGEDVDKADKRRFVEQIHDDIMAKVEALTGEERLLDANNDLVKAHTAMSKMGRDASVDTLLESFEKGGIGLAFQDGKEASDFARKSAAQGIDLTNDVMAGNLQGSVIDTLGDGDFLRTGAFADGVVLDASRTTRANGDEVIRGLNETAEVISESGIASQLRTKMNRAKLGQGANKMLDFYIGNKTNIKNVGIGLLAAGVGYYAYKKYQENQEYDDVLAQQPIEKNTASRPSPRLTQSDMASFRRDPLVTAGVVGNLDRSKIGHTMMGPNKYNHLFGN